MSECSYCRHDSSEHERVELDAGPMMAETSVIRCKKCHCSKEMF